MNLLISVTFVAFLAAVSSAQNCADKWEKAFDCVEQIKFSPDAQTLDKKREDMMKKCVPNMPPQCTAVKKAGDKCHEQVSKDSAMTTLRNQVKENVAKCFERFPSPNRTMFDPPSGGFGRGGGGSPPFAFGGQGPPPPGPFASGPDPCGPNSESQAFCIKNETKSDTEAPKLAKSLDDKQLECFKEVSDGSCQVDGNLPLRDCIEKSKAPFMQQATAKMQECMQAAMNASTPPA